MAKRISIKSLDDISYYERIINDEIFGCYPFVILVIDRDNMVSAFVVKDKFDKRETIIINDRLGVENLPIITIIYECNSDFFVLVRENLSEHINNQFDSSDNVLLMSQAELRVRDLLSEAVSKGASDIHIIRENNLATVNMRTMGSVLP